MYNLFEEERPIVVAVKHTTTDTPSTSEATFSDVANSFLHRIVAWPKILPYADMIKRMIDNVNIKDKTFLTSRKMIVGSFEDAYLKRMYRFLDPQKIYDKQFLKRFAEKKKIESEPIRQWRQGPGKNKDDSKVVYYLASLSGPFCYVVVMICRLFGSLNTQKFKVEWVPFIQVASNYEIMDCATILSNNIASKILEYRQNHSVSERIVPTFYMSAYIMDAICFYFDFPSMGCKWTLEDPTPIHLYHDILWESECQPHFYKICNKMMMPLYEKKFDRNAPRLSQEAMIDFTFVGNWFIEENFTCVKVFWSLTAPHVLPIYVPDKILAREIAYQTVGHGVTKVLKESKNTILPQFPIQCGV